MPFQLIYSSWAAPDLSMTELANMLEESRARNQARDVTGVLVLVDGVFLQIIEGEKADVLELMEKIKRDPRHHGLKIYREGDTKERAFGSWRMAYLSPSSEEVSEWADMEGATTIENIMASLESQPNRLPAMIVNILKAMAEQ